MFNAVTAATEEMAGATIFSRWSGNALGNLVPIRWKIFFLVSWKNLGFFCRITGPGRKLFIGTGLLMANETVHFGLVRKIEIFIFPPVSCVTRCATSLVALDVHSEVVDG